MATVTLNQAGLNQLLREPTGPVMQNMLRRGERVAQEARNLAPEYLGELKISIRTAFIPLAGQFVVDVGSDLPYAKFVEKGTQGNYAGNPLYAGGYNHDFANWAIGHGFDPWALGVHIQINGTAPHPFLKPALLQVAL